MPIPGSSPHVTSARGSPDEGKGRRKVLIRAAAWSIAVWLVCIDPAAAEVRRRTGCAYDRSTGEMLYVETHEERFHAQRPVGARVLYTDPEGRRFAEKSVDFSGRAVMPRFHFENSATGHAEGLESSGDGLTVLFRKSRTSELRRTRLDGAVRGIADAGFDHFIGGHWSRLMRERKIVRPFLIPSLGRFVDFRIRRVDPAPAQPEGEVGFVLEADSALLRLLAPTVRVDYTAGNRRLLRYTGPSNVRDGAGSNFDVVIVFAETPACAGALRDASVPDREPAAG